MFHWWKNRKRTHGFTGSIVEGFNLEDVEPEGKVPELWSKISQSVDAAVLKRSDEICIYKATLYQEDGSDRPAWLFGAIEGWIESKKGVSISFVDAHCRVSPVVVCADHSSCDISLYIAFDLGIYDHKELVRKIDFGDYRTVFMVVDWREFDGIENLSFRVWKR